MDANERESELAKRVSLPSWHGEVLEERHRLVAEGKLRFLDFETAMADLRKEVRENRFLESRMQ